MKILISTCVFLTSVWASRSFASCENNYIVDCGDFKVLATTCTVFDDDGEITGSKSTFSAVFKDQKIREVSLVQKPVKNIDIYQGFLNSDEDLYIRIAARKLAMAKSPLAFQHIQLFGEKRALPKLAKQ